MPTFSDDFNRANGAVGGGWAGYPDNTGYFVVDGNVLRNTLGFDNIAPAATANAGDIEITCEINVVTNGGFIARWDADTNSGYVLTCWIDDAWYLVRYENGEELDPIASAAVEADAGWKTVVWSIVGNEHFVTVNDTEVASVTDGTYTSGYAGVMAGDTSTVWDNFSVTYTEASGDDFEENPYVSLWWRHLAPFMEV